MVEPNVYEDWLASLGGDAGTQKGIGNFGARLHFDAFRSKSRCRLLVGGMRACCPTSSCSIFTCSRAMFYATKHHCRLSQSPECRGARTCRIDEAQPAGAVAIKDPHFGLRPAERCAQREASADAEGSEERRDRGRPRRAAGHHDVGCSGDKIAAVSDKEGIFGYCLIDGAQQRIGFTCSPVAFPVRQSRSCAGDHGRGFFDPIPVTRPVRQVR